MTTPPRILKCALVFLTFLAAHGVSPAQSLYDVVASLSDRQRVISQRDQVQTYLSNQNSDEYHPVQALPNDQLIDWIGVGTDPNPSNVEGLNIGGRIAVLNQAVGEFDRLVVQFYNSSPAELESSPVVGSLKLYTSADFDPLPRATPDHYTELLRLLGQRVRALRLIGWPAAFNISTRGMHQSISDGDIETPAPEDWKPSSIGTSSHGITISEPAVVVATGYNSQVHIAAEYRESGSIAEDLQRTQTIEARVSYPTEVQVRTTAPGGSETQIDGKVYILRRSYWHQIESTALSPQYYKNEAGYVMDGSSSSGTIALFSSPASATVSGSWVTAGQSNDPADSYLEQQFVPDGYQYLKAYTLPITDPGHSNDSQHANEGNWKIGCEFYSVIKPAFIRGVDAAETISKLESANGVFANGNADGNLRLHPRPRLLFGIDLGPGLRGADNAYLSARPMRVGGWGTHGGQDYLGMRFDSTYALYFAGSHSDYHVVYENDRTNRSQSLPDLHWYYTNAYGESHADYPSLYELWDSPRLKQIVGRDLVTNIVYNTSHYGGYTINIYRRPVGSTTPIPGQILSVSGLPQIQTWSFSHPGAGTQDHLANAEELQVTGSGGETYNIKSNEAAPVGGYPSMSWSSASPPWWGTLGTFSWTLKLAQGTAEKLNEDIIITNGMNSGSWESITAIRQSLDGQLISELTSRSFDPFSYYFPLDWKIISAGKTITGSATFGATDSRATRYGLLPTSLSIQYDGIQPDATYEWDDKGLLSSFVQGPWSVTGSLEGTAYKQTRQFNGSTYATDWTEFLTGHKIKTYSAPDGSTASKSDATVAWSEVEYGTATNGLPGLPRVVKNSDGSGATYSWSANSSGAYILTLEEGLLSGSSVSHGTKVVRDVNARGQPNKVEFFMTQGSSSLKTGGKVYSDFTAWGIPKKSRDDMTGLDSTWNYSSNLSRLSTHTSSLGVVSNFSGYDALGRPDTVSGNNITASNIHYTAFSTTADLSGGVTGSLSETRDNLGRLTSSNSTKNGVTDDLTVTPNASPIGIERRSFLGTHTATLRRDDGTLAASAGPTQPFGGTTGNAMSIDSGLFKTETKIADQAAAYQTTWTDAWGRIRKTTTAKGTANFLHTEASSSLQRVCVSDPTGRKSITESDPYNSNGAITRNGIDVDGNGALGASDRYVESLTTLANGKVITTLKLTEDNRLREILRTEWSPVGNQTLTTLNGGEETITRTPNYTNKTVTTTSTKGWSKSESFNNLGLTTSSTLTGAGVPAATLTPVWRADGSLSEVAFTTAGDTHSATFNNNGTLATLTAPSKGNILASHSIANGVETLTVDGVTTARKLDGTQTTTSGSDVPNKTETLAVSGGGFKHTTAPTIGAATEVVLNATAAPTGKSYAAGNGESYTYQNGLLHSVTLARGGDQFFGYSTDGAKDLTSATWPTISSGNFTILAATEGFGYDRAGRMNSIGDASGVRSLAYQNGRASETAWNSGALAGYKIVRGLDASGRDTGFTLYRGNTVIHSASKAPNGVSGEISGISSGTFTGTYERDPARNITSITRGSVIQNWPRTGGRITAANSSVSGAPTFAYTIFDANGRRKNCTTTGGDWTYTYTNGQLTNATHPTLGTFNYGFDGIGRRTENSANTTDLLNRTLAWTNSQSKTLKITAHPSASLSVGIGTATPSVISGFTGNYNYAIPSPGPSGGWVAWNTLAVLTGQGDAGANPDAKAEQSGAVWVPPVSESFAYDNAGNRQASALWDFGWDARNNLVRARTKNYNNPTTPQGYDITCAYDSEGRRFSKKVVRYQNGAIVEQKTITFLWDGWDLIYEREQLPSGLTTCERKYVWGPDISGGDAGGAGGLLLIRETKGNATTDLYPLYDGTGHVTALADDTGALQATYNYGPFGELIHATGPHAQSNPFRYATKYFDSETGLYYFGKRFLDPITGQWLSREPLGESESLNLYSYCANDPLNHVDVQGLAIIDLKAPPKIIPVPGMEGRFQVWFSVIEGGKSGDWEHIGFFPSSVLIGAASKLRLETDSVYRTRQGIQAMRSLGDKELLAGELELLQIKEDTAKLLPGGNAAVAISREEYGAAAGWIVGEGLVATVGGELLGRGLSYAGKTGYLMASGSTLAESRLILGLSKELATGALTGGSNVAATPLYSTVEGALTRTTGAWDSGGTTNLSDYIFPSVRSEIDLTLKYKAGWSNAQRVAADAKASALTRAETVVTRSPVRNGTAQARYRREAGLSSGIDADHIIDLQLGGSDDILNLWGLDSSVNRSLGAQINLLIKDVIEGTRVNRVMMTP